MSKMADIAQQLDEQCVDYGFASYTEALEQGFTYEVDKQGVAKLMPPSDGLEMAHKAWLKERDEVVAGLNSLIEAEEFQKKMLGDDYIDAGEMEILTHAVRFIKEQCHD